MVESTLRNVVFVSLSFWFVWSAFLSQSQIEEDAINLYAKNGNINKHAGYTSLAICFATETIFDPLTAPLVNKLTAKWTMIIGAITSAIFTSCFFYMNEYILYIASALFGFGSAALWVGQGNYLTLNSNDKTAAKHSAIFFASYKSGMILAGILLLVVTKISNNKEGLSLENIKILYGIFTILALIGGILFAFLPAPPKCDKKEEEDEKSVIEMLRSTLNVFCTKEMILICIAAAYIGIQWSFWMSVYPTCVAFTSILSTEEEKPTMLAICVICNGIGQTCTALVTIYMSMKYPKIKPKFYITFALIVQLIMYALIALMFPKEASLDKTSNEGFIEPITLLIYIIPLFLGIGAVLWKSQMYTLVIKKLPDKSAEAFALFNFFESLTCSITFFYSSVLNLYWQIGILVATSSIGLLSVFLVDRDIKKKNQIFPNSFRRQSNMNDYN
uniref:Uncharacterized protein n=1 Tax=Panagrolaimus sp. PS1159 TaxID=55785 RepID=A0AC35FM15_9BILA